MFVWIIIIIPKLTFKLTLHKKLWGISKLNPWHLRGSKPGRKVALMTSWREEPIVSRTLKYHPTTSTTTGSRHDVWNKERILNALLGLVSLVGITSVTEITVGSHQVGYVGRRHGCPNSEVGIGRNMTFSGSQNNTVDFWRYSSPQQLRVNFFLLCVESEVYAELFPNVPACFLIIKVVFVLAFLAIADDSEPKSFVDVAHVPDFHPTVYIQLYCALVKTNTYENNNLIIFDTNIIRYQYAL